jgi:hypothetical protein
MSIQKICGSSALAVGLLGVPALHFAGVDLEGKQSAVAYLARADDHYLRASFAGAAVLLLAVSLVVHLISLRHLGAARPVLAETTTAVAGFAVIGLVLGGAGSIMAAYGAHEGYPFAAVRPMGDIAENLFAVLSPALTGTALLVAVLGLRDGRLPRWLAMAGAVFFVLLTLLGLVLPGVAAIPALLWLAVSGAGLLFAPNRLLLGAPGPGTGLPAGTHL